jgi:hypothetical protein
MITGHVQITSQFQVNMEKECTALPCHASRADIQTAEIKNDPVPKTISTGKEPIRFLE